MLSPIRIGNLKTNTEKTAASFQGMYEYSASPPTSEDEYGFPSILINSRGVIFFPGHKGLFTKALQPAKKIVPVSCVGPG
jgi:hypothetical protein